MIEFGAFPQTIASYLADCVACFPTSEIAVFGTGPLVALRHRRRRLRIVLD